ncbi:MAG: alpha/beta hydrolase [Ruminococcus flavefaciens]|nr:alpha/beta hydrolase [Ruminococcus flavefaciens]
MSKPKKKGKLKWALIYIATFIVASGVGAVSKMIPPSWSKDYTVEWNDSVGTVHKDISYGNGEANKFDLYLPADNSRKNYGLVVYLHAGGFTSGDKSDDTETLQWLCSKGYVTAGINYTLFNEKNPNANIYTQSMEIKESMPVVIAEAEKLGYHIDEMAVSGGSAGTALQCFMRTVMQILRLYL